MALRLALAPLVATLLAPGPAAARLPATLAVTCAPRVRCADRAKALHGVQLGVSYRLEFPDGRVTSPGTRQRAAIRRALRFRTREIRPKESESLLAYVTTALPATPPVGGFVGRRSVQLAKVAKRTEPTACSLQLTICSESRLATLGVPPERAARLCARARRKLRRRFGVIAVATPDVTYTVDSCPKPRPPRTTTTSSTTSSSTTTTSSSTSTTATTHP